MTLDRDQFDLLFGNTRAALLAAANPAGQWRGRLASSALSTATGLFALHGYDPHANRNLIQNGLNWLATHQNPDGGWGDTPLSLSNISTTLLCRSAFMIEPSGPFAPITQAADQWLATAAGSLAPDALVRTVNARYGNDRTFSAPILSMAALSGFCGSNATLWREVFPLPFELSVLPQQLYRWLGLPVVSYALPALIAIGIGRHHHAPPRNPLTNTLRCVCTRCALDKLYQIQPASGGFLEATPLTAFVLMNLCGAGHRNHPVAASAAEFLQAAARPDGSWAIDSDLATWLTTMTVRALHGHIPDTGRTAAWLLDQQYTARHPYTGAPPGGWSWTDLPGGVPDADDTAGALVALYFLKEHNRYTDEPAARGVSWLLGLQNRDGGIPTFCKGWGKLPFDRSCADITAHAVLAWSLWLDRLPAPLRQRTETALGRALTYLKTVQTPAGAWVPLWFGNQHDPGHTNLTYGTARVITALDGLPAPLRPAMQSGLDRAIAWLIAQQNTDGGWGGATANTTPSSIEETAQALEALVCRLALDTGPIRTAIARGLDWLDRQTKKGTVFQPAPIGFYFASLWYYERDYPLSMTAAALARIAAAAALIWP